MEPSNSLLNELLENLAAAGTLRLQVVLDFKLNNFQFMNDNQTPEHPRSPEAVEFEPHAELGEDSRGSVASSEYTAYGEPLYELDRTVQPPRIGSMNSAVLTLLKQLPPSFTRGQFETVIPKAMKFNPVTGSFGVRTTFPNIKRAQQGYFAEFKKRGWVVPLRLGVTLTARLLEDGMVITCLSGLSVAHPPPSKPHRFEILAAQLNNSPLTLDQKEAFVKGLRENGTAEIFLPRHTSKFLAG